MFSRFLKKIIDKLYWFYWQQKYSEYYDSYNISDDFVFNGINIKFYGEGEIIIGKNSHVGSTSSIQSRLGNIVKIGNNCQISHNVRMYTKSLYADQDLSAEDLKYKSGNICIEDNVWIGVNVYIGPGVTIGANSVVAANSVITKDVPEKVIVAGNPAIIIKHKQI